jgi:hypothetical protein
MGAVDSPNLYAFVGWQPSMATDPMGECLGLNDEPCYATANRWAAGLQGAKRTLEVDGSGWGSIALNTLSGSALDTVELFLVDPLRAGSSTGEAVGSGAGAFDVALATVEDVGRVAVLAGAAGGTVRAVGRGARGLRRAFSFADEISEAVSVGLREGAAEGIAGLTGRTGATASGATAEAAAVVEEGTVSVLGREIKVPYATKRLPVGEWGSTDKYGNISLKRGLEGTRFFDETLRHEAVHRFLSPRSGRFIEGRANLAQAARQHSELVRYLEEALAEGFSTRSLYKGLRYPFEMYAPVSTPQVLLEGAGYLGGTSAVTSNASRVADE